MVRGRTVLQTVVQKPGKDIFRPYRRKLNVKFRYFLSMRTEINSKFLSVRAEIKCYNSLFSVRENLFVSSVLTRKRPSPFFYTYPHKNPILN